VLEGGVEIESSDDGQPYVQLQKYNTTLGGQERRYSALPQRWSDRSACASSWHTI